MCKPDNMLCENSSPSASATSSLRCQIVASDWPPGSSGVSNPPPDGPPLSSSPPPGSIAANDEEFGSRIPKRARAESGGASMATCPSSTAGSVPSGSAASVKSTSTCSTRCPSQASRGPSSTSPLSRASRCTTADFLTWSGRRSSQDALPVQGDHVRAFPTGDAVALHGA
jgi:hypothetical protein